MKSDKEAELRARIERKRIVIQTIPQISAEISSLKSLIMTEKEPACVEARGRLEAFIDKHGYGSELGVPEVLRAGLRDLKNNHEQATDERQKATDKQEALTAELKTLLDELDGFDHTAEAGVVAAQQKEIAAVTAAVAALEIAINEQQAVIDNNHISPPGELHSRRQDILAEKAMGNSPKRDFDKEIKDIDADLDAHSKRSAIVNKLTEDAQGTIEGLKRKLSEEKHKLETLTEDASEMLFFFLKTEGEKVEMEYEAQSQALEDTHLRLRAIEHMIAKISGQQGKAFYRTEPPRLEINLADLIYATIQEENRLSSLGVHC